MSQAFNGIGTVIAPVLGSYVFFTFSDDEALANVQWVYLSIAVFVLILAFLFFIARIPEITDADMAYQANETHAGTGDKPFWQQWKLFHAAFAQFCYTGAQVAIASYCINYFVYVRPGKVSDETGAKLFSGAQAAFTVGRFIGTILMKFIKPRKVFLVFLACCIIFIIPAITHGGITGTSMVFIVLFFESICFPTIVALGMRGLGRHTKRGSGFIVGGVIGGACVPPLTGYVADHHGNNIAFTVPLAFFVAALSYPICVNFIPAYKKVVDSFGETEVGMHGHSDDVESKTEQAVLEEKGPANTTVN
jgi:FHS family L-fucose permease-like MFS transporter